MLCGLPVNVTLMGGGVEAPHPGRTNVRRVMNADSSAATKNFFEDIENLQMIVRGERSYGGNGGSRFLKKRREMLEQHQAVRPASYNGHVLTRSHGDRSVRSRMEINRY